MKSKDRLTIMVCTAADGSKAPLSIIGKSKTPECFRYELDNPSKLPMAYKDQSNAWFDREVTVWWITHVFWPWHVRKFGDLKAVLLLDNCSANTNLGETKLPKKLIIRFFPPLVTSHHQPADMGIIATIKVGYRTLMLVRLLALFDEPDGFENAEQARKRRRRGCRGLDVGGKATILDAMMLLLQVWTNEEKYATEDAVKRCWRRADILPVSWNAEINNDVGSKTMPDKSKTISKEEYAEELCDILSKLRVVCDHHDGPTNAPVLDGSLLTMVATPLLLRIKRPLFTTGLISKMIQSCRKWRSKRPLLGLKNKRRRRKQPRKLKVKPIIVMMKTIQLL